MPVFFLRPVGVFVFFYQFLDFLPGVRHRLPRLIDCRHHYIHHVVDRDDGLLHHFGHSPDQVSKVFAGGINSGGTGYGSNIDGQGLAVPATGAYDHGPTLRFLPLLDLLEGIAHGVQLIGAVVFFLKGAFLVLVRPEDAAKVVDRLRGHNILHFADVVHVLVSAAIAAWACSGVR